MNTDSGFKYVFWGLVAIFAISFLLLPFRFHSGMHHLGIRSWCGLPPIPGLVPFVPLALLMCIYVVVVAILVHRDARKRGMDPWLWATIAAFVPYLIGVIIYLVARSTSGSPCIDCGQKIQRDFLVCPYCGTTQQATCPDCRKTVRPDWKACPYCGRGLGGDESPPSTP
jgi:RNA polymerase subunit RPABC4/transcription elongation factor Spt4